MSVSVWQLAADAYTRAVTPPDPFRDIGYTPSPKQAEFHTATEYDVLYGGAAGGGKTAAIVAEIIRVCTLHPGLRVGAFRRTYDELNESLLKQLAAFDFAQGAGATWNGTERELRFPNKSVARFRYAENLIDATRRQGGEFQLLVIDERGLMNPDVVSMLAERVRSGRADIPVLGIRSTTNPGGPGHGLLKQRYIDGTAHGTRISLDSQGRSIRFIPARVDDNPHVDPGYAATLDAIPDPHRRAAMRDGDWDSFAGQAFPEWRRDRHVTAPFTVPGDWQRYAGIDYGYAAPWSVIWAAVDADRRVWVYRQVRATGVGETEQARRILEAEAGEQVAIRWADSAMWNRLGETPTIAEAYLNAGCAISPVDKGPGSRLHGKARLHTYLAEAPACQVHRALGWDTCPRLHVFDRVGSLLDTLPALPMDPRKVEDVDTDADDHDYDALRYLLVSLPEPDGGWFFPETREIAFPLDPMTEAPEHWAPEPSWADLIG